MTDKHRDAASTAPRGSREPGSPEWCYQTMNLMRHSYQHLHIDHERFARYLAELREHKAWEKVPIGQPYGSEAKMLMVEVGKRIDEIETELKAARGELRATKNKLDDDADRANSSRQGERTDLVDNNSEDINDVRPTGTSRAAALRRLRKDRPDIHARVLAGELTPHAGMIEAGFRAPSASRKRTPLQRIKQLLLKLLPELTKNDRDELRKILR